MRAFLFSIAIVFAPAIAQAIEVGDVISFSSAGVSETVTQVSRPETGVYKVHSRAMATNASEYCSRYEQLPPGSAKGKACIRQNVAATETQFSMNCRTRTLTIETGDGSGSYRPGEGGDPWVSTADANLIVRADGIYQKVCTSRR
ncbi:hypothetical protein FV219_01520 [Methylobacterium sp. WL122]|nr:hypothetical protein FV219_01520 [Methylobacterium sp. WL122]